MKYSNTILLRALASCLLIFFVSFFAIGQKNTDSPYSRYGAGLKIGNAFNGNFGMGGGGYAWRPYQYKPLIYDSLARSNANLNDRGTNYINPKNPASFSNLSLTTFEVSLINRSAEYTSGAQSRSGSNTQLSHMTIAFPLGEKWGMGFGLQPFSAVGYDFADQMEVNGVMTSNAYEGTGGINEIFLGAGVQLNQNFALGITGKFLFGNIEDERRIIFDESENFFFNTLDEREIIVSDFAFDFGLQYFKDLPKEYRFIAGLNISPADKVNGDESHLIRNYDGPIDLERIKDTTFFTEDASVKIPFHPTYGLGLAYEKKLKWIVQMDYTYQPLEENSRFAGAAFNTNHRLNLGFEKYNSSSSFGSFSSLLGYRVGLRYNSSLLTIGGEDIQEIGMSFGLSIPLRKSFSTLNLGLDFGRRGKDSNGLIQEDFLNFMFGITINDKWFIQRKYD